MSYLSKRFDLESLKKINIQEVGVYYSTPLSNIKKEYQKEYSEMNTDLYNNENVLVNECDLYDHVIDIGKTEYDYTDEIEIESFIDDLLKDYKHYLVVALHSRWNGASGYKISDSKIDCFYRNYECSQYVVGGSKGGKFLLLKESHHDVPTGHNTLIVGLTDKEYEKIKNMSTDYIIKQAELKSEIILNNKEE